MRLTIMTLLGTPVLAVLSVPLVVGAQPHPPSLAVGTRLRVSTHEGERFAGVAQSLASDSLYIRTTAGRTVVLFRPAVAQIEVWDGTKRQTLKGLVLGFLGGGIAGALVGSAVAGDERNICGGFSPCVCETARQCDALTGTVVGAIGGLLVGGLVGYLTHRDRWRVHSSWPTTFSVTLAPGERRRWQVRASLGFSARGP